MLENFKCGDYVFDASFDSGNLQSVELVRLHADTLTSDLIVNAEFNVRSKPDCGGTAYENQNRSWFYFSIFGGEASRVCKINVVNMNKQAKLYTQGMQPVMRVGEGPSAKWERIREPVTHFTHDEEFTMSFLHKPHANTSARHYYAFTFPFSYIDCQEQLGRFDEQLQKNAFKVNYIIQRLLAPLHQKSHAVQMTDPGTTTVTSYVGKLVRKSRTELETEIYYHRELLTYSVEGRRVDLLTVSAYNGIQLEREPRLAGLFPDKRTVRCNTFKNKKIIFISSRVHPGETPASFVLNGFFKLIFDPRNLIADTLRKMYVFKIVPFLNPDGVHNGHYRSDTFGSNLNRLYLNPSPDTEPTIYAVRKLIRYYHFGEDLPEQQAHVGSISSAENSTSSSTSQSARAPTVVQRNFKCCPVPVAPKKKAAATITTIKSDSSDSSPPLSSYSLSCPSQPDSDVDLPNKLLICDELEAAHSEQLVGRPAGAATRVFHDSLIPEIKPVVVMGELNAKKKILEKPHSARASTTSQRNSARQRNISSAVAPTILSSSRNNQQPLIGSQFRITKRRNTAVASKPAPSTDSSSASDPDATASNLFLYVDLHGHASKKGIFMYGNHMPNNADAVECMLLPRLMSMNCTHFHFDSCVFSEKNMYSTGKRDGMSKEGSGRVAVYKATGLVKCYTLEGNYNTGKYVNVLPPRGKEATPRKSNLPVPKYTPTIFEDVGRALGPSILDLTGSNPMSRIQSSEFRSINGMRRALFIEMERGGKTASVFHSAANKSTIVEVSEARSGGKKRRLVSGHLRQLKSTKRSKANSSSTIKPTTTIVRPPSSTLSKPSKENKLKIVPAQIFSKFPIDISSSTKSATAAGAAAAKKSTLLVRSGASKTQQQKPLAKKNAASKSTLIHISKADLRDASTSMAAAACSGGAADSPHQPPTPRDPTIISPRSTCVGDESSRSVVFYSASDSSVNNELSTLDEASSDAQAMPPPATLPFSYGKRYGNSSKLFVSGRRKTLKMRPKMHLSVPSLLLSAAAAAAGSTTGGRAKPLKRGSSSASKDSLRLKKKKNKVLKVDNNDGSGATSSGGATKRTKARLL